MDSFINDNIESAESESVVVLESSQRKRKRRGKEKADGGDAAAEKSDRKFAKKLKFYSKVKENVALLNATKTIGKKSRNARKRQKTLKAYDLTELAEILRELPTRRKRPVPLPKPGKKCKSRQTLVLKEANRLQTVLSSPTFQSYPLAAIFQHLQSTQPAPETKPKKKSDDDKKRKKKKSKTSSAPQSMEM